MPDETLQVGGQIQQQPAGGLGRKPFLALPVDQEPLIQLRFPLLQQAQEIGIETLHAADSAQLFIAHAIQRRLCQSTHYRDVA